MAAVQEPEPQQIHHETAGRDRQHQTAGDLVGLQQAMVRLDENEHGDGDHR
jgi:hypothetical protein